ncbi:hypothetical protein OMP38_34040 [Cohnella ginsengisoli]|uniref:Uncharacterized protein n=1 Tax=Cohnella ginsengisoli TaxID=425004 RepID=A0A9X4QQD1_9BACL|nr:hypothetical protein [Cohnella ginsengisoli]MDG0795289.1 hypothetical protein [Cohnella ginsengisoli]
MTMIYHHHMLEEQVREQRREIEAVNREAWKRGDRRKARRAARTASRGGLQMVIATLWKWF